MVFLLTYFNLLYKYKFQKILKITASALTFLIIAGNVAFFYTAVYPKLEIMITNRFESSSVTFIYKNRAAVFDLSPKFSFSETSKILDKKGVSRINRLYIAGFAQATETKLKYFNFSYKVDAFIYKKYLESTKTYIPAGKFDTKGELFDTFEFCINEGNGTFYVSSGEVFLRGIFGENADLSEEFLPSSKNAVTFLDKPASLADNINRNSVYDATDKNSAKDKTVTLIYKKEGEKWLLSQKKISETA